MFVIPSLMKENYHRYTFQTCVGTLGILGNILIIIVLSTKQMRHSFNLLLIVLSIFDIRFTIIAILDYGMARGRFLNKTTIWLIGLTIY